MIQQLPDYRKQLEAIIQALNRQGVSPWLLASFSVFLGILGGIIGRFFEPFLTDFYRHRKMRRLVYVDLGSMAVAMHSVVISGGDNTPASLKHQSKTLKSLLRFTAEDYIKANKDIYVQLREYLAVEHLYIELRKLVEDDWDVAGLPLKAQKVIWLLGMYLDKRALQEKYFSRYLRAGRRIVDIALKTYKETVRKADAPQ